MPVPPITPADVRARLAAMASPGTTAPRAAPPPDARDAVLAGISSSYFRLRRGLAVITLALPPVLWLGAGPHDLQASISAYYHFARGNPAYGAGTMRDVFVGVLWTIGAFLFFYRGYSRAEDRALNLAGIAAIVVALCPMDWPPRGAATPTGHVHAGAAVVFFLAIAYVAIARSGDTLVLLPPAERRGFTRLYRLLGCLMVAIPLSVVVAHALLADANSRMLWLVEVAGIYTFSAFWLVKSREIARIEAGPAA